MRRLLAPRGTPTAAVGVLVLIVGGGGYALAAGDGNPIHACVHRHGGGLYVAKKCARHDRKLSWNEAGRTGPAGAQGPTGPAGPGATYLVYNATGGTSNAPTTIGTLGPFTFFGVCTQSAGTTTGLIGVTESGARLDGIVASGTVSEASSGDLPALTDGTFDRGSTSSTTPQVGSSDELAIPASGPAIQLAETLSVTGGSTNTCHFTATGTPTALAGSASVASSRAVGSAIATTHRAGLVIAGKRIG